MPTPVDHKNNPDLSIVLDATIRISKYLKKGDTIILESTIYPGATDEIIIPLIERQTNFKKLTEIF